MRPWIPRGQARLLAVQDRERLLERELQRGQFVELDRCDDRIQESRREIRARQTRRLASLKPPSRHESTRHTSAFPCAATGMASRILLRVGRGRPSRNTVKRSDLRAAGPIHQQLRRSRSAPTPLGCALALHARDRRPGPMDACVPRPLVPVRTDVAGDDQDVARRYRRQPPVQVCDCTDADRTTRCDRHGSGADPYCRTARHNRECIRSISS